MLAMVLALLLQISDASAQSTAGPAANSGTVQLSDQQLNQIVQSVTGAVLSQMKAGQPPAGQAGPVAAPAPRSSTSVEEGIASFMQKEQAHLVDDFGTAIRAVPAIIQEVGSIAARTDRGPDGRGTFAFLALVAAVFIVGLALGKLATLAAQRWLPGTATKAGAASIGETLRHAGASFAGLAVFWVAISMGGRRLFGSPLFGSQDMQAIVGHWLMMAGAQFALLYTILTIFFRPSEPAYRIVPLDGPDARVTMRLFAVIAAVMIFRSWIFIAIDDSQPEDAIDAGLLLNNLLFVVSFFVAAVGGSRTPRWATRCRLSVTGLPATGWR